jgi:hypothetical protein
VGDLDQFRGKRALVIGVPFGGMENSGPRFEHSKLMLNLCHQTLGALGIEESFICPGVPAKQVRKWLCAFRSEVVIVVNGVNMRAARAAAALSGVPVLRVRRDGKVEVDGEQQ